MSDEVKIPPDESARGHRDGDALPDEAELDIEDFPDGDVGLPPGEENPDPYLRPLDGALIEDSPPIVSYAPGVRSLMPKKLSHRLKYVAHLKALGCTNKEIAEKAGYTQHRVSVIMNSPHVSAEVERMRRYLFERDPDVALRGMIPKALKAIDDVLSAPNEKLTSKADIAFRLFERTHGKPKQTVDMGGNMLSDLFALLDARDESPPERSIPTTSRPLDETLDTLENDSLARGDSHDEREREVFKAPSES